MEAPVGCSGVSVTIVLVIAALALTVVARFVSDGKDVARIRPSLPATVGLIVTTIIVAALALKFGQAHYRLALASGLTVGALAIYAAEVLGGLVAPIGVAVVASTLLHFLPPNAIAEGQFALLTGLAIGVVTLTGRISLTTAIVGTTLVAADFFGAGHKNVPASIDSGSLLGLSALLGMIAVKLLPAKVDWVRPIGVAILIAAAGFVLAKRIDAAPLANAVGLGAITALVLNWLAPDDERDVLRLVIAGIIAVSMATVAYSFYRVAGVSAALVAMLTILFAAGNKTAVLTASTVFGIVLIRLLQKADSGYTTSLDIGQHFILLGVFLGVVVPLLPLDKAMPAKWKESVNSSLWFLLLVSACVFVEVMLGHRGVTGFVAGLGISGIVSALRAEQSLVPIAIAPGLVGVHVFCLDRFENWTNFSRDEKVKFFIIAGVITIAMAGVIALLSRPAKKEVAA